MSVELVVAGNLLVDDLVRQDGSTRMGEPGGGALYVSLAASLWGVKVGLVSLEGNDYPPFAMEALRAHAVDLAGVRKTGAPSLRTWLLYERAGRQIVRQLDQPSHASVSPGIGDFPDAFLGARMVHVCPTPFEYQRGLVEELARRKLAISLDPHETVREETIDAWGRVLDAVELFFVSHEELRLAPAGATPEQALLALRGHVPQRAVLLKRGEQGGTYYDANEEWTLDWTSRAAVATDTTGAGDAFAGGFLAGWLRKEPLERALARGVVSASFAIESWGPHALIAATPAAAERRLLDWYGTPAKAGGPALAGTPPPRAISHP